MLGLRKALVFTTLVLGVFSSPKHSHKDDAIIDWEQFQALLDTIDSAALHSVLHSLSPKFQDGVFSKDRSAIEHVHSENPIMASKLVYIAKKRQASNSTTTATPSTPAETSAAQQSSSRAASVSQALASAIIASTVPAATTITVAPTAPLDTTPISTAGNGAVVYSTYGGGLVTLTSSAIGVSFTPSTSTHLFYTTLSNGDVSTSTSVVVVNAPLTGTDTSAAGAAATTGSKPGLQNSGVKPKISGLLTAFAVCIGGFFVMVL